MELILTPLDPHNGHLRGLFAKALSKLDLSANCFPQQHFMPAGFFITWFPCTMVHSYCWTYSQNYFILKDFKHWISNGVIDIFFHCLAPYYYLLWLNICKVNMFCMNRICCLCVSDMCSNIFWTVYFIFFVTCSTQTKYVFGLG